MGEQALVLPCIPHVSLPSPTLHGDFHRGFVCDAPQGLDVARCRHGPAAVAVFLVSKRVEADKVCRPYPPPPTPWQDWTRLGQDLVLDG